MLKNLLQKIADDETLDQAYQWMCDRRKDYSHNDDVWFLRQRWHQVKPWLQAELIAGRYRFYPLHRIHRADDCLEIWSALDLLVLKAIAIILTRHLAPTLSKRCTHLAGNGGAKAAVRLVLDKLVAGQQVRLSH